jgi:GNAT superfamily N-acetyltransferase
MSGESIEIVPCTASRRNDALSIALRDVGLTQREQFAAAIERDAASQGPLHVAISNGDVIDAVWGQLQPGNSAFLWSPRGIDLAARRLVKSAVDALDETGVRMTQAIVPDREAPVIAVLESAGFEYLAELVYLSWQSSAEFEPPCDTFTGVAYDETQLARFSRLIEATYVDTRDCPAMNGRRPMDEVLSGYRATGVFRPENWRIARVDESDIGVLLLADHGAANFWELIYMGIVPQFRGRALGRDIVRHAQQLVRDSGAEQMLVAVDAANAPALAMYESAGFSEWDRRIVYVRFNPRAR